MNDGRLALDDDSWNRLTHRGGTGTGEVDIPGELRKLLDDPTDDEVFDDLWPYLSSEDTTWPAAYAAVPHLVDSIAALPAPKRAERLPAIGLIVTYGDRGECPEALRPAYDAALDRALVFMGEALPHVEGDEVRWLLAAVAALRDRTDLAEVLVHLDSISEPCPSCGEEVYPEQLQAAAGVEVEEE